MTEPEDENGVSIEPTFDAVSEQEEDHALRVKLVFIVVFGPAVALALAGFYNAAGIALIVGFAVAFGIMYLLTKLDQMDL